MFPMWAYVAIALATGLLAFAMAQLIPALGAILAAGVTMLWVAWAARRINRRWDR